MTSTACMAQRVNAWDGPSRASSDVSAALPATTVSLWQKLLSASVGAVTTSLVTNPLEVVKTRMQTQLPTGDAARHPPSTLRVASNLLRNEGVRTLWSGLKPALLMQVPSTVLYFAAYDEIKSFIERENSGDASSATVATYAPLLAGVSSRTFAVSVVAPLELLRTKAMYRQNASPSGLVHALRSEMSSGGGLPALWRGWGPTLLRDVPFSGIYWLGYERMRQALYQGGAVRIQGSEAGTAWLVSFLSGLSAGSVAALVTTPFDVVKTRRQVEVYVERAGAARATQVVARSTAQLLQRIASEEGIRGLFAGVGVRVARVGPACAIMISAYDVTKLAFHKAAAQA